MNRRLLRNVSFFFPDGDGGGTGGGGNSQPPAPPKPAPPANNPPAPPAKGDGDDEKLGEAGLKALQAERDARKQAEDQLKAIQKQIDDAKKTAEEKAAEALQEAQKAATENATKALRYEVAAEKGLPLALASRLTGSTKEELLADADTLKSLIPAGAPGAPKPDPSVGNTGDVKPKNLKDAIKAHYTA